MPFYQYLVKKWGLKRVEFTGQQNPQEYYRHASIFLMTSTAEGWGMVILEALQMGVPVIAMDSFGALHDMITNGYNGSIVPNNDLKSFLHAMKVLMEDDSLRKQMAINAVESSKRFEIPNILALWKRLFDQLTND